MYSDSPFQTEPIRLHTQLTVLPVRPGAALRVLRQQHFPLQYPVWTGPRGGQHASLTLDSHGGAAHKYSGPASGIQIRPVWRAAGIGGFT